MCSMQSVKSMQNIARLITKNIAMAIVCLVVGFVLIIGLSGV